ncbi:hypothetical protein BUALT_Bualt04G0091900 [Buddleja alternifolia]|uniref:Uncharacterized protein n=1 Tax=Buddleja alternifolia TaxID=168488 RepID=A0AAV6XMI5_9LAMI|nr:hypothetical protein BUALT_Bualt04G0091900 [Buddleja alternifolia]
MNASDGMQGLLHDVFGRQNDDYPMGDPQEVTDEGQNTKSDRKHKTMVSSQNPCVSEHEIHRIHAETFASWFKDHVQDMQLVESDAIYTDLKLLARGPIMVGRKFSGFLVNEFRRENRLVMTELSYYGAVRDMIELDYLQERKVVLFDWMARTRKRGRTNRLPNVNQQEEVLVHHKEGPRSDGCLSDHTNKNKPRGCTFFPKICGLPPGVKLPVQLKKFGQPIDDNSSQFSTFLGTLAKMGTYCPIDILDWRQVPKSNKKEMLGIVQGRKIVRKPTRAEMFNLCFPMEEEGEARQLMVSTTNSYDLEFLLLEISDIICLSLLLQETMRGLINELDDPSQDVVSRNDVYSKANGPEKPGRFCTYGHGVTPTDLFEQIPSRRSCYQMIQTLKERLDSVESRSAQQNKNDVSSHVDSGRASSSSYDQRISTLEIHNPRPLRVSTKFVLL